MRVKRFLILAPLLLVAFLLQSYLWVPTYERQTAGNPGRVRKFIVGRIGDAKILNPALNADSASSEVVSYVFEGLLDLDEDLQLRGRLATTWEISETAYLAVNPAARLPDGSPVTAGRLLERINAARRRDGPGEIADLVAEVRLLPPERREETRQLPRPGREGTPELADVRLTIDVPERLAFELVRVDPGFFERLAPLVGEHYADSFPYGRHIRVSESWAAETLASEFPQLLPVAEHNPVILFHLRRGVRFHDDHEFDAGDVKFTYEAIMNPKNLSPRTSDFEPIKEVQVLDRHTVRVVYKRLFSPAIYPWTYMGMLPEHLLTPEALEAEMDRRGLSAQARATFGMRDSEFNRNPVGTGRFRFVDWHSDEFIYLERYEDHWDSPAEFHDVYIRIIPDMLTQEVEFRTGAVDQYSTLPHQAVRYREDDRYLSLSTVGSGYSYIGYNIRRPLFEDGRVRRALGMVIDVDQIIRYILFGEGDRVTGPYPINTPWYDHSVEPQPYDPEGALRLLAEAGWKKNAAGLLEKDGELFEFNLITNHGNPIRKNIMTIAQNSWKKIGIRCNTQQFEWAVFLEDFVNPAKFDAVVLGWGMGIDPDIYQIWHSSQTGPQQLNFVGYRSPEADELIVRIREEYDPVRQRELTHQLHRRIAEDQPYTFLFAGRATTVFDKKIVIVEREPDGSERYRKPYVTKHGMLGDYQHKLRKLEFTPDL